VGLAAALNFHRIGGPRPIFPTFLSRCILTSAAATRRTKSARVGSSRSGSRPLSRIAWAATAKLVTVQPRQRAMHAVGRFRRPVISHRKTFGLANTENTPTEGRQPWLVRHIRYIWAWARRRRSRKAKGRRRAASAFSLWPTNVDRALSDADAHRVFHDGNCHPAGNP
jgi:hypothetical protein